MIKTLFSVGQNRKLDKQIPIFNLPHAKTCPGRTKLCKIICYADKAERLYKNARKKREYNLKATFRKDFVSRINKELQNSKSKLVRIHESGDMYRQSYLNKWIDIANANQDKKFLAFTKSMLDFSKVPKNFIIRYSIDITSKFLAKNLPKAIVLIKQEERQYKKSQGKLCHPTEKHTCGSKCVYCWQSKRPVYFPVH